MKSLSLLGLMLAVCAFVVGCAPKPETTDVAPSPPAIETPGPATTPATDSTAPETPAADATAPATPAAPAGDAAAPATPAAPAADAAAPAAPAADAPKS